MKVLNFDADSLEHFRVIYEGLAMTQYKFNNKEARRLDKLFTALESVGKKSGEKLGTTEFYLLEFPTKIELEDADFDLLKSCIEPPNVPWNGAGARKAGKALTWLDNVKAKENKPELVKE